MSACPDVIPAQLINNIIPSAAAPLKGMTGSHEGSAKNINIYGSVRELKAKLTALASLTLRPAMIHRASRKTDIQYLHGAPLLPLIAELCFLFACVYYIYLVPPCRVKAGYIPYEAALAADGSSICIVEVVLFPPRLVLHPSNF